MKYEDPNENDEFAVNCSLLSVCCGKHPLGETFSEDRTHKTYGVCSDCWDFSEFTHEAEEE
jgi:hypothetical protein